MDRIVDAVVPGLMPKAQHTAHGGVDKTLGQVVVFPAVQQHVDDGWVHGHGGDARLIVDGLQIVHAFIFIVDVEKPMVCQQLVVDGLGLKQEFRFGSGKAYNGCDSIEEGQKGSVILLAFRL